MYKDIQVVRLTPDSPTKGGSKKSLNEWQVAPQTDTFEVQNIHVWQGSWRREAQSVDWSAVDSAVLPDTHSQQVYSLHPFVRYGVNDNPGMGTSEILSHNLTTYTDTGDPLYLNSHVFNHTTNEYLKAYGTSTPVRFATIRDRVLMVSGGDQGYWYAGSDKALSVYPLGVDAPELAPACTVTGDQVFSAQLYGTSGSEHIQSPSTTGVLVDAPDDTLVELAIPGGGTTTRYLGPSNPITDDANTYVRYAKAGDFWCALNRKFTATEEADSVGLRIQAGDGAVDAVIVKARVPLLVAGDSDTTEWNLAVNDGLENNGDDVTTIVWLNSPVVKDVGAYERSNDKPPAIGDPPPSTIIVLRPYTSDTDNVAVTISGYSRNLFSSIGPDVPGTVANSSPFLVDSGGNTYVREVSDISILELQGTGLDGALSWEIGYGPSYAYAFYDPISGHVSNISPVTVARKMVVGVEADATAVAVSIDMDTLSLPVGEEALARFTHILFFRNYVSAYGSSLYVLGSLNPTSDRFHGKQISAIQPGDVWIDTFPDSDLLLDSDFLAPRFTNGKPKYSSPEGALSDLSITDAIFWDGRLWCSGRQDPTAVKFSCDRSQCPLGRPEESFPLRNELRIPAEDGRVVGMRLWSERILITTERWAYTVSGSSELDYRLIRLSTRMAGVGPFQMDELPSETEESGGGLVFMHPDSRIYVTTPGSEPMWISQDVQNTLSAWTSARTGGGATYDITAREAYQTIRIHVVQMSGRRLIAVANGTTDVLLYDIDQKIWTQYQETGIPIQCFATLYGTEFGQIELAGSIRDVDDVSESYPCSWLGYSAAGGIDGYGTCFIATTELDFDSQKSRKQVMFVRLIGNHDDADNPTWIVGAAIDGDTTSFGDRDAYSYTGESLPYAVYKPSPTIREWVVQQGQWEKPLIGYRFRFTIKMPNSIYATQLYAIDIGFRQVGELDA